MINHAFGIQIYGTATVAQQGQVVIPAKLRKEMSIQAGDSLIFFTRGKKFIGVMREVDATKMIEHFERGLNFGKRMFENVKQQLKKNS